MSVLRSAPKRCASTDSPSPTSLSVALLFPFDPTWRRTFTAVFNEGHCTFLKIALGRLLKCTMQERKFSLGVWKHFFLKTPMIYKMANVYDYRFLFFYSSSFLPLLPRTAD